MDPFHQYTCCPSEIAHQSMWHLRRPHLRIPIYWPACSAYLLSLMPLSSRAASSSTVAFITPPRQDFELSLYIHLICSSLVLYPKFLHMNTIIQLAFVSVLELLYTY